MNAIIRGKQYRKLLLNTIEKNADGFITIIGMEDNGRETAFIFAPFELIVINHAVKCTPRGKRTNFQNIFHKLLNNGVVTP